MELMECFENVNFIQKGSFFVVGLEADINYNYEGDLCPITGLWEAWRKGELWQSIPDQVSDGVFYGITHSEDSENKAKCMVCVEVSSLANLPAGFVGRKFPACEHAVFDTTLDIIWSGNFWRTFYAKWLPSSGYALPDKQLKEEYPTFTKYPDIEVYPKDWKDKYSTMQIYAPVVKNNLGGLLDDDKKDT